MTKPTQPRAPRQPNLRKVCFTEVTYIVQGWDHQWNRPTETVMGWTALVSWMTNQVEMGCHGPWRVVRAHGLCREIIEVSPYQYDADGNVYDLYGNLLQAAKGTETKPAGTWDTMKRAWNDTPMRYVTNYFRR